MRVVGVSPDVWISSAALIEDGNIVAAAAEERFDRIKMSKAFPVKAMEFCLEKAGLNTGDIDNIAVPWNPGTHIQTASIRYSQLMRWRGEYLYSVPSYLLNKFSLPNVNMVEEKLYFEDKSVSIFFVDHHLAHAANGFYLSPYEEAAILTIDGKGESETCLFAKGEGTSIKKIKSVEMPHSIGLLYSTFTEFLGFKPDSDEWKVMALAAYENPENEYYEKIKKIVCLKEDGTFDLDLAYFTYYLFDRQPKMYSNKFVQVFGPPRIKRDKMERDVLKIAAALQKIYEELVIHMLHNLYKVTKCTRLVLSGGCAMNSVFNGKITSTTPFKEVFISSCPDDSGTSIGAALYVYNSILGGSHRIVQCHNYWGPEFSNEQIEDTLRKFKVKYAFFEDIENNVAQLISQGKLLGWFQGKMEFGQRSLGNRSIIADPRNVESKQLVNQAVKYRESFRPFAPSILEEYVDDYFLVPDKTKVPFMEKVYEIKNNKRPIIPAVVHEDGSGRLQTVSKETNPLFYSMINKFREITGVPLVLNTSFNLNGEPLVCSPTDTIRTFFSCGLDFLAIGNYLVQKE
jgi:carbamoyltransferase|tara:strand:- start:1909 stop:3618 length:1710 start_codon:yes stop_codon:yes gene_type:complete